MPFPAAAHLYTSYSDNGDPTDPAAFRSGRQQQRFEQIQGDLMLDAQSKREQEAAEAEHRKNLAGTMAGDVTAWMNDPQYQKGYAQEPQEFKQHMIDAYGPVSADAPQVTNDAARAATGNPMLGVDTSKIPPNSQYRINAQGQTEVEGQPTEWSRPDPALLKAAQDEQIPTTDDKGQMLNRTQLEQKLYSQQQASGELPAAKAGVLNRTFQKFVSGPEYVQSFKVANSMNNFLSTVDDALSHPNTANNMAVIDNFIRTQNPGGVVRQGTMAMVKNGQAILQKLTPEYLAGHAEEGQMLTTQFVKDAQKVMEEEVKGQDELFQKTYVDPYISTLKRGRIPTDDFVSPYKPVLDRISKGGQTDPYQQALEWLKANPKDPQAAAVREMLARKGL